MNREELFEQIKSKKSFLCVGLDSDPEKNPDAEKFPTITGEEVLEKRLSIMDLTAFTLCRENETPIIVFNMNIIGNLSKVLNGEEGVGSTVVWEDS
jgi:uridylate kinase